MEKAYKESDPPGGNYHSDCYLYTAYPTKNNQESLEKCLVPYQGKYNVRLRHFFGHKGRSGQGMIGIYQEDTGDLAPLMVGWWGHFN